MTELRGITWDHPRGIAPMRATAAMYERAHPNVHITWTVRSLQAFGDQSIEQLAAMYDLLVIDHPFVGAAARSGCLVALETRLPEAFLRAQAHESVGASYESYTYDGHQWALPIDAAAQVAAYRPDVLDARDLAVPGTWTHVFDLMRVVGGRHVALPLSPVNAICSFLSLCANQGMSPSVSGSDPRCLAPRPVEQIALDILRRFVAEGHPESLHLDPPGMLERMAHGDDIVYRPLVFGYSNYARPGYAPHVCRFANIPAISDNGKPHGAILGGTGLAVSAACQALPAACAYVQRVADEECQRTIYVESGGQPGNRRAWMDPVVNGVTSQFFRDTLDTLDHAYLRPRHDGFIPFQDRAGLVIHDYLRMGGDVQETLDILDALYLHSTTQIRDDYPR